MTRKILFITITTMSVTVVALGVLILLQLQGSGEPVYDDDYYTYEENTEPTAMPTPTPSPPDEPDEIPVYNTTKDPEVYEHEDPLTLLVDPRIQWHIPPTWDFDQVFPFVEGMAGVEYIEGDGDDWHTIHTLGYMNIYGEIVIPIEHIHHAFMYAYTGAPPFSEGLVAIRSEEHLATGVFDTSGNQVVPFENDFGWSFSEGLMAVRRGGHEWYAFSMWGEVPHWGFIDTQGNVVIPFEFDHATDFSYGRAAVMRDGHWGFIDRTGEVIIPFIYGGPHDYGHGYHVLAPEFHEELAVVSTGGNVQNEDGSWVDTTRFGFIDIYGNEITPFIFTRAGNFSSGLAVVRLGEQQRDAYGNWYSDIRWGAIDATGNIAVPFYFRWIGHFYDGLAVAQFLDSRYHVVIDTHGEVVFSTNQFNNIYGQQEGRMIVQASTQDHNITVRGTGFIDARGNLVVPPVYSNVRPFSQGFAAVNAGSWVDDRWGFIDLYGNIAVPLIFEDALSFSEGFAWVRHNGLWGILRINED